MRSDDLTTEYMNRFRSVVPAAAATQDVYMRHYCSGSPHASSAKLKISIEKFGREPVAPTTRDWKVKEKLNLSERNLLCMDSQADQIVVGGADHALRVLRVSKKLSLMRTLYTKRSGHTEWVTCAVFLPDGKVASGGMDSKICVWGGTLAKELLGHAGSVSKLLPLGGSHLASASYDRSIKIWCTRTCKLLSSLHGHTGAVLDVVTSGNQSLVTAGRDGSVRVWDINEGKEVCTFPGHKGQATCLLNIREGISMSGGTDGRLIVWDHRSRETILSINSSDTCAPVAYLLKCEETGSIVSAATDTSVTVLNANDFSYRSRWKGDHTCHVYSMALMKGGTVATGGGEGTLAIRSNLGQTVDLVKVDGNAIRAIATDCQGTVVLATDDGNIVTI